MSSAKRKNYREWLKINLKIGSLTFGGSGRSAFYELELVQKRKWVTDEEFQQAVTLSSIFPGPNLVNLVALLGQFVGGWGYAFWGLLLLAFPGALLMIVAANVFPLENWHLRRVLEGISIGSALVFFVYIARLLRGIKPLSWNQQRSSTSLRWDARVIFRAAVVLMAFLLAWYGTSLVPLIVGGSIFSILGEVLLTRWGIPE